MDTTRRVMREILTICPSPRRTRGRLSGKAPTRRRPIYCVPSAHFGGTGGPICAASAVPFVGGTGCCLLPSGSGSLPFILFHVFWASFVHILCFPFVSQPTDLPLSPPTWFLVADGLTNETMTRRCALQPIIAKKLMQCIFQREGFGAAAVGLVR